MDYLHERSREKVQKKEVSFFVESRLIAGFFMPVCAKRNEKYITGKLIGIFFVPL
jgi:hypothetical protein